MRRTKIVATVGPATSRPESMQALLAAGADVVRLNAAHASAGLHTEHAALARATAAEMGRAVGVLVDLPGPKMRTGPVVDDELEISAATELVLTADEVIGDEHRVSTTLPELARWVSPGDEIYLTDG